MNLHLMDFDTGNTIPLLRCGHCAALFLEPDTSDHMAWHAWLNMALDVTE